MTPNVNTMDIECITSKQLRKAATVICTSPINTSFNNGLIRVQVFPRILDRFKFDLMVALNRLDRGFSRSRVDAEGSALTHTKRVSSLVQGSGVLPLS